MSDHSAWLQDMYENSWVMPFAPWWKRLPMIRHVRTVALKFKVEEHYTVGMGGLGLRTGYDDWVLYGIWHGLTQPKGGEVMDSKTHEKLDLAVQRYVEALDLDSICELAQNTVRSYYKSSLNNAEMQAFIDEMEVTDEDVGGIS
jgi:hypothetical protein